MRPEFHIHPKKGFEALNLVCLGALLVTLVFTAWNFGRIPDTIPSHFDASGTPDNFQTKGIVWALPVLSILVYLGLTWLGRRPHILNYPVTITANNSKVQYENAVWLITSIKCLVLILLTILAYFQLEVSLGQATKLPIWLLPVTVGSIVLVSFSFIVRSFQLDKSQ